MTDVLVEYELFGQKHRVVSDVSAHSGRGWKREARKAGMWCLEGFATACETALAKQLEAVTEDLKLAHIRLADISDWPVGQLTADKARRYAARACEDLDAAAEERGES